ncbi:UdgX family uracil-DNA binding protein [Fodinicola acaciae]|uniref:UdgX family uracil-DNA binding protein n=1 Tax=Fodinicola acaciae TaxID=2681555 RepID=UPI0013D22BEF|nr:UdgX family uracil-DNA binding protein [Fodinicola acaciae]
MTATRPAGAEPFLPERTDLAALRAAVDSCRGCPLYADASQAVFGDGPSRAKVVMVGEQPGDVEDREGEPFVGPAGHLLDKALDRAGIDRAQVYLTNAVKHFKFTRSDRGKPRIHKKPAASEITACRPWIRAELAAIKPRLVVCLGAVAAQSLLGKDFRVTKQRGVLLDAPAELGARQALATIHPSAVLRATERDEAFGGLVADLTAVSAALRDA